jgi:Cys-rich protein (TIGR01571 family)
MSCFCPAVSVAQIAARMGLMEFYHVLGAFAGLYFLAFLTVVAESNFLAMSFWLATIAATLCLLRLRSRLRIIFSIPGSTLEDAFFAVCCGCCSIAQMATHVESYEPGKLAFAPRETLPGYSLK